MGGKELCLRFRCQGRAAKGRVDNRVILDIRGRAELPGKRSGRHLQRSRIFRYDADANGTRCCGSTTSAWRRARSAALSRKDVLTLLPDVARHRCTFDLSKRRYRFNMSLAGRQSVVPVPERGLFAERVERAGAGNSSRRRSVESSSRRANLPINEPVRKKLPGRRSSACVERATDRALAMNGAIPRSTHRVPSS
jgi:hypothetical protein